MSDADIPTFQALCHEAVLACGADLQAIERYIAERLAAMDEQTRRAIRRDVERVLAFRAPDRSAWRQ